MSRSLTNLPTSRTWWTARWTQIVTALYFLGAIAFFTKFWWRQFVLNDRGDLLISHILVKGDWAIHFTMGFNFVYRSLFLTESPLFADTRFSYPFIVNWISAVLIKLGVPWVSAFWIPSYIFCLAVVVALFWFYYTWFKSKIAAVLGSLLFFCSGGWGLWSVMAKTPWSEWQQLWLNPDVWYTDADSMGIRFINVVHSMLLPQRAFELGFPLTLIVLTLVLKWLVLSPSSEVVTISNKKMIGLGLILGLLPIIHTHSFLASGLIIGWWCVHWLWRSTGPKHATLSWSLLRPWAVLAGTTLLLALPLWQYFFANQVTGFIKFLPGWLSVNFEMNWVTFWWLNWGLVPYAGLTGWWLLSLVANKAKQVLLWVLAVPFWFLFVICNLFIFQPWDWDNTKLLVWASVGISGLAGWTLRTLVVKQLHRGQTRIMAGVALVVILLILMIGSGASDLFRIVRSPRVYYTYYNAEEFQAVEWVKQNTDPHSRWVTDSDYNHWLITLTGRQTLMVYPGWLWSQGYDYAERESDVQYMLTLWAPIELYQKYDVDYIATYKNRVVTPNPLPPEFTLVYESYTFAIYKFQ